MNIRTWMLFAILFICQIAYGEKLIDSLKVTLSQTESKLERARVILQLSKLASESDANLGLKYAEELMQVAHESHSDTLINKALLNLAKVNLRIGNYPRSLDLFQEVLKRKNLSSNDLLSAYNGIGIINYYQRDYKNAVNFYNKALLITSSSNAEVASERLLKQSLLNNLGILYEEMKEFDKANHFYNESLKLSKDINDQKNLAHVLTNQARLYHKQGKNDLALKSYLEALEIRKNIKDEYDLALSYDALGEFYFELKQYTRAEEYLKEAIKIGERTGDLLTIRRSSSNLYKLYQQQENYKLAFEALVLNKQVSDTLFNDDRTNKIAQLKIQFDFERKHREEQAKQRERELILLLIGIGLILSLIIVSLLFYLQRNKIKNSLLEQAHLLLEKENLKKDIKLKDRELTASTMHLMQKNELIGNISEKLLLLKQNMDDESQHAVQKVVTDLNSNLRPELLKEFEFRFNQVHEEFYDILNEKFPNLTPSERKLCAFLKLGMTTKEISAITLQNIKSIEIARTRLRKKLNLTNQDYNLVTFLAQL